MSWNGFVHRMGCSAEFCVAGPKGLQRGHLSCACQLSVYIPGQKYLSRRWSWMCSGPKQPFALWAASAMSNPWSVGMHSVLDTWSLAFVLTFHSLPSAIIKSVEHWVAQCFSAGVSPAESPRRWRTIGWKKISFMNCRSRGCFGFSDSEILRMSLMIPLLASQSVRTV